MYGKISVFFQAENQAAILEEVVNSPQTQDTKLTESCIKSIANTLSFSNYEEQIFTY